jgi:hypothetical protein
MRSGCKVKRDRHHLKTAETTISESSHSTRVIDGGGGGMHLDQWAGSRRIECHESLCAPLRRLKNDISQHESDIAAEMTYSVCSSPR